jgi:hypothetical protein
VEQTEKFADLFVHACAFYDLEELEKSYKELLSSKIHIII